MRHLLLFLAFFFLVAAGPSPWEGDRLIGSKAPDFLLRDTKGQATSLAALKGKVVLVCFWATWCPPCRAEIPSLDRLYKDYKDRGFMVVGISTDRSAEYVKDFLKTHPVGFPMLMDSDTRVSRQYGVFSMPTSFLLDRKGIIIKRYIGEEDWGSSEIRNTIKSALEAS